MLKAHTLESLPQVSKFILNDFDLFEINATSGSLILQRTTNASCHSWWTKNVWFAQTRACARAPVTCEG